MRIPALEQYVVSELLRVGADTIEKSDWMTMALEKLYENKQVNDNWEMFTNRCITILNDAITEVRVAKTWTHKP